MSKPLIRYPDWKKQWGKVQCAYETLLEKQDLESAYTFFEDCIELRFYLNKSGAVPKSNLYTLFNHHWEMRLCSEIHARRARLLSAPEFQILHFTHVADRCMDRWRDFLNRWSKKKRKK